MKAVLFRTCLILAALLCCSTGAMAQHAIDIQKLTSESDYFEALRLYQSMPKRKLTSEAIIAAGKSAWALSLPQKAIEEFEKALQAKDIDDIQRARLLLSRGIIEYQEGRYRIAVLFAERMTSELKESSPLRSKGWLLWAESLSKLNSYGAAEKKYLKALKETEPENVNNIYYKLGQVQLKLGKLKDARASFEHIPLQNINAPGAIRALAEISLQEKKYEQADFWLQRGIHDFRDYFIDSWVDYARIQVAVNLGNKDKVSEIQADANNKYPPSDEWLTLINAAVEEFMWNEQFALFKN